MMTVKERIQDIMDICGLSEDIVRRVLAAERESIKKSLRRGEKATLIGRCTITPELRTKLRKDGSFGKYVKLSVEINGSLAAEFEGLSEFEKDDKPVEEIPEGVRIMQISSLT